MIALQEAWSRGLLKRGYWANNLMAGAIVGVVALPLGMAFAIASGLKPEQGLYTAIIAGLVVSVFGGSRVQIAGPTGAFIVILSGIVAQHGVLGLQVATVMAGGILIVMGLLRLGQFIKFIPDPVIVGFTSGIAVLIWFSQWPAFLGLPDLRGDFFHERLWHLLTLLPQVHWPTTAFALLSLAILVWGPRVPGLRRIPGPLLALVACTALQALCQFQGVATIGSRFGGIPQGLPPLQPIPLSLHQMIVLMGPAFTIAMLGAIESLLSAVVADGMAGTRHDSNQELIGQGLANLLVPFFGGFAATGAMARTATNIRYGGNSPLAGVTHALTLVLVLLCLAPLAVHIPLCTLAAILFVVAFHMSELAHFIHIVQFAPKADVLILVVTALLTLFTDLVVAVNVGMILTMLQVLGRMSATAEVRTIDGAEFAREAKPLPPIPASLVVYSIEGPFFFGAVEKLEHALAATHTDPETILIRLGHVPFMDITGLEALETVVHDLKQRGVTVLLCEANERVHHKLERIGILQAIGPDGYFQDVHSALMFANHPRPHA